MENHKNNPPTWCARGDKQAWEDIKHCLSDLRNLKKHNCNLEKLHRFKILRIRLLKHWVELHSGIVIAQLHANSAASNGEVNLEKQNANTEDGIVRTSYRLY